MILISFREQQAQQQAKREAPENAAISEQSDQIKIDIASHQ